MGHQPVPDNDSIPSLTVPESCSGEADSTTGRDEESGFFTYHMITSALLRTVILSLHRTAGYCGTNDKNRHTDPEDILAK